MGERYVGVQYLRAIACLLVVLQHSIFYGCLLTGADFQRFLKINYGDIGVFLFFCISGYVITLARKKGLVAFVVHRLTRIYPPYWFALAISALLMFLVGATVNLDLASIFLIPTGTLNNSWHIPYWTLIYEMAFYVLIAVFMALRLSDNATSVVLVMWIVLIHAFEQYQVGVFPVPNPDATMIFFSPVNQLFAMGALFALNLHRASVSRFGFAILAVAGFGIARSMGSSSATILMYSLSFCSLIMIARDAGRPIGSFRAIGDASYGIYLLHAPIIFALFSAGQKLGIAGSVGRAVIILFVCGLAGGFLFGAVEFRLYRHVARKLEGVLAPWLPARPPAAAPADAAMH